MNCSAGLMLHGWRGVGPDIEPDLFLFRYRLGLVTVCVERRSLLEAYRKLRGTIIQALSPEDMVE